MEKSFINAYKVTREFGGYEEGGWWFDNYKALESLEVLSDLNHEEIEKMIGELKKKYAHLVHGNITSVLGGAEVHVYFEDKKFESETLEKPIYE